MTVGALTSWLIGATIVRVGLAWSDTFPYSPASEWRYLAIAMLALASGCAGTAVSILLFLKARRRVDIRRVTVRLVITGIVAGAVVITLWCTL